MSNTKSGGENGHKAPESISRSSSITLVSPEVRDNVGEIARKLEALEPFLDDIHNESQTAVGHLPEMSELVREISKLTEEVQRTKADQAKQIEAMKTEVRENTKVQVLQSVKGQIHTMITDEIASQVRETMAKWSKGQKVQELVGLLQATVDENRMLLVDANISWENSRSRRANSTIDIQDDFYVALNKIKLQDGRVSELFPENLRELFSYDADQLVRLIKEHGLRPLDKHGENMNRFIAFIGINAVIPEQLISFSEEQLPPYGNAAGFDEEKSPRMGRRESSASQDAKQNSKGWSWF